ncbi:hypothetical protein RUND412_002053 [Rhizina undulata]
MNSSHFLKNVPVDCLAETQITDIFSSVGRVISFRLVFDRQSGRPKGYGFAEYQDAETAASAVRNLDNYEIMGRKLRVDYSAQGSAWGETKTPDNEPSNDDTHSNSTSTSTNFKEIHYNLPDLAGYATNNYANVLSRIPAGVDLPQGLSAADAISGTLRGMPEAHLLEIVTQMKVLVNTDPALATTLLSHCPQLSYALFQAMLTLKLVEPGVFRQVTESGAYEAPPTSQSSNTTPSATPAPTIPPAAPAAAAASNWPGSAVPEQDKMLLLQQVMSLTPQQMATLPSEQQQQLLTLKQRLMVTGAF